MSCARLGRGWRRTRGFRLHSYRFYIVRLRVRLFRFLGFFFCHLDTIKGCGRSSSRRQCGRTCSGRTHNSEVCQASQQDYNPQSLNAEAIADCLEFIKRSSMSVDDGSDPKQEDVPIDNNGSQRGMLVIWLLFFFFWKELVIWLLCWLAFVARALSEPCSLFLLLFHNMWAH